MITGYRDANQTIQAAFIAAWAAGSWSATPVFYMNELTEEPTSQADYVLFRITAGMSKQISLGRNGNRIFRHTGILTVTINKKLGSGSAQGELIGDYVASNFRGLTLGATGTIPSGVVMKAPRLIDVGAVAVGQANAPSHYRHNVIVDFYFDILA